MARSRRDKRMAMTWIGSTFDQVATTTTQAQIGTAVAIAETGDPVTLLRTRGTFLVSAIADAVADSDILALGLIVVSQNAQTAGGASMPGPISDQGASWIWHEYIGLDAVSLSASDANARAVIYRGVIDSKAMRKVRADQSVVLMAQLSTGDFVSVSVTGGFRTLLGH